MAIRTRGQLEAEITNAIVRFEKEYMGRGPVEAKSYLIDDMIVVRLKGVLTPAEQRLATGPDAARGRDLVKQVRQELIEKARPILEAAVEEIVGRRVVSLHTDVSTRTGERILVLILSGEVESA